MQKEYARSSEISPRIRRGPARTVAAWVVASLLGLTGCGGGDSTLEPEPEPEPATYAELVAAGWASFAAGNYPAARSAFAEAVTLDPAPAEAYVGLGWSELKRDVLTAAHQAFESGSGKTGADPVLADLFAGWAFVWNARKTVADNYGESNSRIVQVETLEPDWQFDPIAGLGVADLVLLAAENHFALGDFDSSLARVQALDPAFVVDVATPEGQAALAEKIELLQM